jgi:hypothetical protein
MKFVKGMASSLFNVINDEISGKVEDKYVSISASFPEKKREIVPFARHSEVPNLGKNHDLLIKKSERLFHTDEMRLKWLLAVHDMKTRNVEYLMEPMDGEELKKRKHSDLYPKWCLNPPPEKLRIVV